MAERKVEVLEGELVQLKSNFEDKILDFQNQFAFVHEKMDGKFAVVKDMLKKLLEAKPNATTSETKEAIGGQGRRGNPIPFREKLHEYLCAEGERLRQLDKAKISAEKLG
ncbi:hypothetical protein M5K25_003064 [Dendrobium thyrsiflorum]|uniref:Uncharacterized protein n=1 Tax=Dendrobium thyrsiflorum TaxID=117978 RepID=A0ABD0VQ77_DENTH